jgi:hypothetical protein
MLKAFALLVFFSGCVGKVGIVRLSTDPAAAKYFLNGVEKGTTPAEFEWNYEQPILLELKKEEYHPEKELLNKAWLQFEASKGSYGETKTGKVSYQWVVTITRQLKRAPPAGAKP